MLYEDIRTLIVDSGGDTTKAGFGKDAYPCSTFPTLVGRPDSRVGIGMGEKHAYVGQEVIENKRPLTIKCPIEQGYVTNWDDMECVWHRTFYNKLRVEPEEHPVLITEKPFTPKCNREKTTQIMFETFNIPALYITDSALLSLYGAGRTTGLVLESGHTASHTVPIFSGSVLPHAIQRLAFSGSHLTDSLTECLSRHNSYSLDSCSERETMRHIKEKLTRVSLSYKHDTTMTSLATASYELPDGKVISLGSELSRCPEALFQPSLLLSNSGPAGQGIHESVCSSISKCAGEVQRHLYANIVLSGGSSLFPGLRERLEREVSLLSPLSTNVRVIAPAERKFLAWIGGANLTSLSTFSSMWISKQEYDESGPMIIRRRVF